MHYRQQLRRQLFVESFIFQRVEEVNNPYFEKNVLEFLNDLKFILYLKYDNFSTTWCMTRLPLLPIIYVRAHYIIQLEIHKNTSYFSGNTDAAVNRMECSDWSIEISKNKLGIFGCI